MNNCNSVLVQILPLSITDNDLYTVFSKYGDIQDIQVQQISDTECNALITFVSPEAALEAQQKGNGETFNGQHCETVLYQEDSNGIDSGIVVIVDNLPFDITPAELSDLYSHYEEGTFTSLELISDDQGQFVRGYVVFTDPAHAEKAIRKTDGKEIGGFTLAVYLPPEEFTVDQIPAYVPFIVSNDQQAVEEQAVQQASVGDVPEDCISCCISNCPPSFSGRSLRTLLRQCGRIKSVEEVENKSNTYNVTADSHATLMNILFFCSNPIQDGSNSYSVTATPILRPSKKSAKKGLKEIASKAKKEVPPKPKKTPKPAQKASKKTPPPPSVTTKPVANRHEQPNRKAPNKPASIERDNIPDSSSWNAPPISSAKSTRYFCSGTFERDTSIVMPGMNSKNTVNQQEQMSPYQNRSRPSSDDQFSRQVSFGFDSVPRRGLGSRMSQQIPNDYLVFKRTVQPTPFSNSSMEEETYRQSSNPTNKPAYQSYPRPKQHPQAKPRPAYHKPQPQPQPQPQQPQLQLKPQQYKSHSQYSQPQPQHYQPQQYQPQPQPQQYQPQQYQQPQQPLLQSGENAVLVENLNVNFNEKTVRGIFRTFGPIQRVQFVDANTVALYFEKAGDASTAIRAMNDHIIEGNRIIMTKLVPDNGDSQEYSASFQNQFMKFANQLAKENHRNYVNHLIGAGPSNTPYNISFATPFSYPPPYAYPPGYVPGPYPSYYDPRNSQQSSNYIRPMATMPVTTPLDDDNAHTFEVKNKRKQTVEQTIEPPFDIPIPSSQPSQPNNDMIVLIEDTIYSSYGAVDISTFDGMTQEEAYGYLSQLLNEVISVVDPDNIDVITNSILSTSLENIIITLNDPVILYDAITKVQASL